MNDYIGIPFVDGGRDRDGLDCWGLVKLIFKDKHGIELPDFDISAKDPRAINGAMEDGKADWMYIPRPELIGGEVLAMSLSQKHMNFITHVGYHIGYGKFLHIMDKSKSIISSMTDPMWSSRIRGAYAWAN